MGREPDTQTTDREGDRLSVDTIFELLSNSRRRHALRTLRDGEQTTLRALSEQIAASENGIDSDDLSAAQRKRVTIGLYQSHLPKLQRAGVVDYDRNRGTVVRTALADQLDPFLELAVAHAEHAGEASE